MHEWLHAFSPVAKNSLTDTVRNLPELLAGSPYIMLECIFNHYA